jgi:uncharacterized protein YbcI
MHLVSVCLPHIERSRCDHRDERRRSGSMLLDRRRGCRCLAIRRVQRIASMTETPPGWDSGHTSREIPELKRAISAAIVALYETVYGHDRTTAKTYINDNVVVCVLQNILTEHESLLIKGGSGGEVIDGRVAFQTDTEDEFTAAVERLTQRRVVAFLSANQTTPGVACELFVLDATPLAAGATP